INAKTKKGRYVPQFSRYHREVANMPTGYDSSIPRNTRNHGTRGQTQVRDLIKCWLLKWRAGGKEIVEKLKSEIACVEKKFEDNEREVLNEMEIMKSTPTTKQNAGFLNILEERLGNTNNFREELREKVKRALRRKKIIGTAREELEEVKFLRHLQGHELDRVMSYLEIEDLVKIVNPKNISITEEE
ncbi:hypothetical protein KQX54_000214, partial [Cotesia glomerata]